MITPQEIRAILTEMQDDSGRGDLDAVYPYYADDLLFHRTALPDTVGKEANRKGDEAMLAAFTDSRMTIAGLGQRVTLPTRSLPAPFLVDQDAGYLAA